MLRLLVITFLLTFSQSEGVKIEAPSSGHVLTRTRTDLNSIDPDFRHYILPNEILFHAEALQDGLPFFLQCKGSKSSLQLTVPPSAVDHLSLNTDYGTHTVTATLRRKQLRLELVGRYTCSETTTDQKSETSVFVFIQDGLSVFTKRLYPKVLKETGVHFFNLPCQATSWYPKMSCPPITQACSSLNCNGREKQVKELKCNTPSCEGQEICIPVYYTPANFEVAKVFYDPQIGFALVSPNIPSGLTEFTCMSNYTPSQVSRIPYSSYDAEFIQIHHSSFHVMPEEQIRLTCEIRYGTKMVQKIPSIFWFGYIYDLRLVANETEKPAFNLLDQIYSRNSSITLRGFKAKTSYRFYCVRVSEQGTYSRSIEITCVDTPTLELDVILNPSETGNQTSYGSDTSYDMIVFTVPRSKIILEISRNGSTVLNDKRFELTPMEDRENQFYDYTFTIYNITFEDETDIKILAKSSKLQSSQMIKPTVIGNPVGQISFIPAEAPPGVPWRDEDYKAKFNIYSYGIYEKESYRVVCTVRHRADIQQPLNVYIKYVQCSVDNCLSDLIDQTCRSSTGERLSGLSIKRTNPFQTEFTSSGSQTFDDPSIGHQYVCCYEQNQPFILAKGLTAIAHHREMFNVIKPEFSLVTGDVLNYRCVGHELIYEDLRMIYNDGYFTYERERIDSAWRLLGTKESKQVDVDWLILSSEDIRDTTIEIKTPSLTKIGKNGYIQCIALSRRSDLIANKNDTYVINVDDPVRLQFLKTLPRSARLDHKTGDNVDFDCSYVGRPQPKVTWSKGKLPLTIDDTTLQLRGNNGSIHITRAQATDTGVYTCLLRNGRDPDLTRSFDLRVKGPLNTRFRRFTAIAIIISSLLILILLILLIVVLIKYYKMKRIVDKSMFHVRRPNEPEDKNQPPMTQLTRIPLPENFATKQQVRTLLGYVNGGVLPTEKEDFKELGHGQFGVVYQVRLPDVNLVAAKLLPQSMRNVEKHREKRKKHPEKEESEEMLEKDQANRKTKAAEMLIDEIKVMYKAGKHVNIISLIKVAYPEASLKNFLRGGIIRDEDSFYLMELCSNGSLESMLKRFLHLSPADGNAKPSLYQTLAKQTERGLTIDQALEQCQLTEDDLKLIAYQVASGIDYLNRIQIAHCDIAARNVLVNTRFIMKICDFGLATWTTYKNYREQLAQHDTVQLEKKNNELATHNLTPELAVSFIRASSPDERLLLNKSSMKSDVWSFGIFLWTLFLKCRLRPFHRLSEEVKNRPTGQSFFHRLARAVSEGRVLDYIDYQPEIPREIYAVICNCLTEENQRPEMTTICSYLCHADMLSKPAFDYYVSEYNRYQEENPTDGNVQRFGGAQGRSHIPTFDESSLPKKRDSSINYRHTPSPSNPSDYYPATSDQTSHTYVPDSDRDYPAERNDSYLVPTTTASRTIAGKLADEAVSAIQKPTESNEVPRVVHKPRAPLPPTKRDNSGDSYV